MELEALAGAGIAVGILILLDDEALVGGVGEAAAVEVVAGRGLGGSSRNSVEAAGGCLEELPGIELHFIGLGEHKEEELEGAFENIHFSRSFTGICLMSGKKLTSDLHFSCQHLTDKSIEGDAGFLGQHGNSTMYLWRYADIKRTTIRLGNYVKLKQFDNYLLKKL